MAIDPVAGKSSRARLAVTITALVRVSDSCGSTAISRLRQTSAQLGTTRCTPLGAIATSADVAVSAVTHPTTAAALFAIIPIGAVGARLVLAGVDLAVSRRLSDGKPSCWWVIGVTVTVNPAFGLALGWISEFIRAAIVHRLVPRGSEP